MKTLTSFLILAITLFSSAQEPDCNFAYRHYTGTVGSDSAVMDLMILNREIKGSIVYPTRWMQSGEVRSLYAERLEGEIDQYLVATLEAYPIKGQTGEYSGKFEDEFKGTYRDPESGRAKSIHMTIDYGESVDFRGYCVDRDTVLLDTINPPRAQLNLAILLPEGDSIEYIRNAILEVYFRNDSMFTYPDNEILPLYCKSYFRKYIESNIDIYDGGFAFNWEMSGIASISMNRYGLLVYRADNYAYTGGAHGMGVSRFLVFDTFKKTKLSLSDIFQDETMDQLGRMLESKYREMHYLNDDEPLSEAGLFDDHITPSPNFWITESSISFFYNPYELAPYAMGSITISLPYKDIQNLLREETPVKRLSW